MNPISALGASLLERLTLVGAFVLFVFRVIRGGLRPPYRFRLLFKQMHFVGIQSLTIVIITATFTGMVFAVQSNVGFSRFGSTTGNERRIRATASCRRSQAMRQ